MCIVPQMGQVYNINSIVSARGKLLNDANITFLLLSILTSQSFTHQNKVNFFLTAFLFNNYSPKAKWIFTNIHESEANNCFSVITQVIIEIPKQRNFTILPQFAIVFFFGFFFKQTKIFIGALTLLTILQQLQILIHFLQSQCSKISVQLAVVDKSSYHAARINVSRNAFLNSRSEEKNIFFDVHTG